MREGRGKDGFQWQWVWSRINLWKSRYLASTQHLPHASLGLINERKVNREPGLPRVHCRSCGTFQRIFARSPVTPPRRRKRWIDGASRKFIRGSQTYFFFFHLYLSLSLSFSWQREASNSCIRVLWWRNVTEKASRFSSMNYAFSVSSIPYDRAITCRFGAEIRR